MEREGIASFTPFSSVGSEGGVTEEPVETKRIPFSSAYWWPRLLVEA